MIRITYADFIDGVRAWRLWTNFAWHDMVSRYRRSWVGPFWLMLSAATFIGALSLVYSTLFQMDVGTYVPFVAIGVALWMYISAVASESVATFVDAEAYIRQIRINLFVYVLRVIWRNMLVFAHYLVVALFVLVIFGKLDLRMLPLAAVGLLLCFLQSVWVTPLFGLIGTRFRDLQPIIANSLQLLFFVTPVIWFPASLGSRQWIAYFNPLHSLIAVVREPLLGNVPTLANYAVVLVMTAVGSLLAVLVYGRFKTRVVYWL